MNRWTISREKVVLHVVGWLLIFGVVYWGLTHPEPRSTRAVAQSGLAK